MSGPPKYTPKSVAYKSGWLDGYGDRPKFDAHVDADDPDYIAGRAKGAADKVKTDKRLKRAGLR